VARPPAARALLDARGVRSVGARGICARVRVGRVWPARAQLVPRRRTGPAAPHRRRRLEPLSPPLIPIRDNLPTDNFPVVTLTIIVINVLVFLFLQGPSFSLSSGQEVNPKTIVEYGATPYR